MHAARRTNVQITSLYTAIMLRHRSACRIIKQALAVRHTVALSNNSGLVWCSWLAEMKAYTTSVFRKHRIIPLSVQNENSDCKGKDTFYLANHKSFHFVSHFSQTYYKCNFFYAPNILLFHYFLVLHPLICPLHLICLYSINKILSMFNLIYLKEF